MSSPSGSVRKRAGKDTKSGTSPNPAAVSEQVTEKLANVVEKAKPYKPVQQGREWDYRLAISVLTVLAFVTRFWGIRHPDQVVFDEVHFGKVRRPVVEDPCSFHVPNREPYSPRVCC
jgi:dolichyl-phosphate-mannose-protein mannosyltransferase